MASDPLVDYDCAYLDGHCTCEIPQVDCKYSGKPFPVVTAETIRTVDLNRRPALKEEIEKNGTYVQPLPSKD